MPVLCLEKALLRIILMDVMALTDIMVTGRRLFPCSFCLFIWSRKLSVLFNSGDYSIPIFVIAMLESPMVSENFPPQMGILSSSHWDCGYSPNPLPGWGETPSPRSNSSAHQHQGTEINDPSHSVTAAKVLGYQAACTSFSLQIQDMSRRQV